MPVYLIVDVHAVRDKQKYAEYIQKVPATIAKFKGTYLARGGKVFVASGDWNPKRLVIVKFPSMKKFREWWGSPAYRAIAPLREQSTKTNAVVVQGLRAAVLLGIKHISRQKLFIKNL